MKKIFCLIAILFTLLTSLHAAEANDSIIKGADDPNFVTASMVVITPGASIYSVFGHTAIRMQCPSKHLDYCFSFETESGFMGYVKFFAGQSHAGFVPVPAKEFIDEYAQEGRGVTQYELNLTPHEKQELWRALDNDMMEGAHRKFNLIKNNCTSMSMLMLESIMDREYFQFGKMPEPMYYNNGKGTAWLSRRSPWAQFVFMSFLGSEADVNWPLENKLNPELIIPVLKNTTIKSAPQDAADTQAEQSSDSIAIAQQKAYGVRPALIGSEKTLLSQRVFYVPSTVTPTIFFLNLLALSIIWFGYRLKKNNKDSNNNNTNKKASVLQSKDSSGKLPHITPLPLGEGLGERLDRLSRFSGERLSLILYTLLSLFLLYVTLVSGLFGVHWNWLLIPFNPIPFIVWLVARHRSWYPKVYLVYAVILFAFCAIVPWITTQLLPAHYLMVATMAVLLAAPSKAKNLNKK